MATRLKVLIDLNVILDVLQGREPFYVNSAQILAAAELGSIDGLIAAHNLTTLHYLVARYLGAEQARIALQQILLILNVTRVDQAVIEAALGLNYGDFEDAVSMMSAIQAGADYVVSRDIRDFQKGPLPILTPAELLSIIKEIQSNGE